MKGKRTYSIIGKLTGAALIFSSIAASIPVYAARTEEAVLEKAGTYGAVSGNAAEDAETGIYGIKGADGGNFEAEDDGSEASAVCEDELASLDWENRTDEELTDYFFRADERELAGWLACMPYDSFAELIRRDTWLLEETVVQTFGNAFYSEEEGGVVGELLGEETMPFYEKVLLENGYSIPAEDTFPAENASYFANAKGEYYYKTYNNGAPGQNITVTLSGLSTDVSISDTDSFDKLKVTVSSTGSTAYGAIAVTVPTSSSAKASQYGYLLSTLSAIGAGSSDSRIILTANIALNKKAGYRVDYAKSTSSGIFKCVSGSAYSDAEYAGDSNYAKETNVKLTSFTSVTENSSVGKRGNSSAQNIGQSYSFNFIPADYTVKYDANGAKNGLAPSDQTCRYGSVYHTASIGTLDNYYTISYDLNYRGAGTLPETHAKRIFGGWALGSAVYDSNQAYSNLATGGVVTMKARWSASSEPVQLPIPQEPAGHTFIGWATTKTAPMPDVNSKGYVAGSDVKLYAMWGINSVYYVVNHYIRTSEGGEWELFRTEDRIGNEGEVVTIDFSKAAIEKVNAVPHYKCRLPQSITVSLSTSMDRINYFYDIERDASDPYWLDSGNVTNITNNYTTYNYKNNYGMTEAEVKKFIETLAKNGNAKISIDGVRYTIVKNAGQTYSIHWAETGEQTVVTVPSYIRLGDREFTITEVEDGAFKGNGTIRRLIISNGILTIGDYAFYHCTRLERAELADSVLKIGKYAFAKCAKLSGVKFSKGCHELGEGVFSSDAALSQISLSSKLTAVPKKAFYRCTALKKLTLSKTTATIGISAFEGCGRLKKVTLPEKVSSIGKKAFYNCKNLKSVKLKTTVLRKTGAKAFCKCREEIQFHVPPKKLEAYKKLLNGKY